MSTQADVTIVGAGIVGLATAMELLKRHPSISLKVLEKEQQIGLHQTGHNSGVIHSGIYYTPGSLKARLCVEGGRALMTFCDEHGIPFDRCGKVIVATEESELGRLDDLHQRGIANAVPGLEMIGPERLRELEPHAAGIKALFSPNTAIIDFNKVAAAYADEVRNRGGEILTGREVVAINQRGDRLVVETKLSEVPTRHLITCGGLYSDRLAAMTGAPKDPRIVPFRGDYWVLRGERRELVRGLIYPVPDPALPFLGVHFTKRWDGAVWAGPTRSLPSPGKDTGELTLISARIFRCSRPRVLENGTPMVAYGVDELYRDFVKPGYLKAMQRYVPDVRSEDIEPGPSGVRAQALDSDGRLVDDFVVHQQANAIHVRNAPSPAATSSLAIAGVIVDKAEEAFALPVAS